MKFAAEMFSSLGEYEIKDTAFVNNVVDEVMPINGREDRVRRKKGLRAVGGLKKAPLLNLSEEERRGRACDGPITEVTGREVLVEFKRERDDLTTPHTQTLRIERIR